jgi:FtsP/CotA-like multicopper oxidase with cupredoxin domain
MTRGTRLAFLGAAVVVVIVAVVITTSGGGSESSDGNGRTGQSAETGPTGSTPTRSKPKKIKPKITQIRVVNGEPAGGVEKIEVEEGERVRFKVSSDVSDEVHVHGYDHIKNVAAGGSVKFNFKATISGSFEIELEHRETQIASLTVEP